MSAANRYRGLSGPERSVVATVVAVVGALILAAIWLALQPAAFFVFASPDRLIVFDVPPPPPPPEVIPVKPPPSTARVPAPKRAPATRRPDRLAAARSPSLGAPAPIVPVPIVPIITSPLTPVALDPSPDPRGVAGIDSAGSAGGSDTGSGSGDGGGAGGRSPNKMILTHAAWIRPPDARDFAREWPYDGRDLKVSVDVVLLCAVRKSGRPFDCVIARESVSGKGFGRAAVRLAEGSLVKPVMVGNRRLDIRVIVSLTFAPAGRKPAARTVAPTR